jgi:hypothetical protein
MPQGSPKKIQVDLLLADLALQLGDLPLGRRQLVGAVRPRPRRRRRLIPTRPAPPAQRLDAARPVLLQPMVQAPKLDVQRLRHFPGARSANDTLNRRSLQL